MLIDYRFVKFGIRLELRFDISSFPIIITIICSYKLLNRNHHDPLRVALVGGLLRFGRFSASDAVAGVASATLMCHEISVRRFIMAKLYVLV